MRTKLPQDLVDGHRIAVSGRAGYVTVTAVREVTVIFGGVHLPVVRVSWIGGSQYADPRTPVELAP